MFIIANSRGYFYLVAGVLTGVVGLTLAKLFGASKELSLNVGLGGLVAATMSLDYLQRLRLPRALGWKRLLSPSLGGSIYWIPVWIIPLGLWLLLLFVPSRGK